MGKALYEHYMKLVRSREFSTYFHRTIRFRFRKIIRSGIKDADEREKWEEKLEILEEDLLHLIKTNAIISGYKKYHELKAGKLAKYGESKVIPKEQCILDYLNQDEAQYVIEELAADKVRHFEKELEKYSLKWRK